MKYTIHYSGIEKTEALDAYVEKRLTSLDKYLKEFEHVHADVEVGKTTRHHMKGDVFRAEAKLHLAQKDVYVEAEKDDLYAAIDEIRDELASALKAHQGKQATLMRRGAAKIKNFITKGIFPWQ